MARPEIDNTRSPGDGPHLRYAQVYSVTAHVATVQFLTWDGSGYVTYGPLTVIGGYFEPGDVGKQMWVVWRKDQLKWLPLIVPSAAGEKFRLIRGQAVGGVLASAGTFNIDNIVVLAGGNDPRATPGDMAETLSIVNSQKETFIDNEPVIAIYWEGGPGWQTLVVERYRAVRGQCTAAVTTSDGTFTIDNIVALESGIDPRADPDDDAETLTVYNVPIESHADNDKVWADFSAKTNRWEARPKGGSGGGSVEILTAMPGSAISAGTASAPLPGTGEVFRVDPDGSTSSLGSGKVLLNPFEFYINSSCTVTFLGMDGEDEVYLIVGVHPKITCATTTVVTDVGCLDGVIVVTTSDLTYLHEPCP